MIMIITNYESLDWINLSRFTAPLILLYCFICSIQSYILLQQLSHKCQETFNDYIFLCVWSLTIWGAGPPQMLSHSICVTSNSVAIFPGKLKSTSSLTYIVIKTAALTAIKSYPSSMKRVLQAYFILRKTLKFPSFPDLTDIKAVRF